MNAVSINDTLFSSISLQNITNKMDYKTSVF